MISDTDLPAIYEAADQASLAGQRRFLMALRFRLGGYVAAAVGGAFSWIIKAVDVWGVVAACGLLLAIGAELYAIREKPDRTWYEGRAAAESVKTLGWRYMVGGAPFGVGSASETEVDNLFARELREVFIDLTQLDAPPVISSQHQITDEMRRHRSSNIKERRELYDKDRIEDQRSWYASKARWNSSRARTFELSSLVLQVSALALAALKAFGVFPADLLGIAGSLGGSLLAWSQAKQHRSLASAYSIASQELATIRSLMSQDRTEEEWASFVDSNEEAISREHTLWRASRGVSSGARRVPEPPSSGVVD